jgi:glutathione peroxidase
MSDLLELPVTTLLGASTTLGELTAGRAALVVNVASRCGQTPQYAKLEKLHEELADRGFTVVAFPCNQFGDQEPGTADDIASFCSATYGVTFPMSEKIDVNGPHRDPIYGVLAATPYADGAAREPSDIGWNFEKFVVSADGRVVGRFHSKTQPDNPEVLASIETVLAPLHDDIAPSDAVQGG